MNKRDAMRKAHGHVCSLLDATLDAGDFEEELDDLDEEDVERVLDAIGILRDRHLEAFNR